MFKVDYPLEPVHIPTLWSLYEQLITPDELCQLLVSQGATWFEEGKF